MGTTRDQPEPGRQPLSTVGGYLLLFVFGAVQGVIGSFQYSDSPSPEIAILFTLIIFATCVLAGFGLRTYAAGIVPALGWIIASFILAMPRSNGSVIVTATAAGEWYLYGGAVGAVCGAIVTFFAWTRSRNSPESR